MTDRPTDVDLSIVICTRDRAAQLEKALLSLDRLSRDISWEAIVVDNASSDRTQQVIGEAAQRDARIRFAFCERPGLGAARNVGWRTARGAIIAFTDDDCYPRPDFVETVLRIFEDHGEVGFIGGRLLAFDANDAPISLNTRAQPKTFPPCSFIPAGDLSGANLAFRRTVLEAIGGFDPCLGAGTGFACEDVDAAAAASWAGFAGRFDPELVVYHHHGRRGEQASASLTASYDRGRGAYYMRYLLRRETRGTYLRAWLRQVLANRDLPRFGRELRGALAYAALRARKPEV